MKVKKQKACKRKKCPYYNVVFNKCSKCEWNPNALWTEKKQLSEVKELKNWELIAELSKLPAGAEVEFDCLCDLREVTIVEDSDDGEYYSVRKEICSVDTQDEKILLS